MSGDNNETEGWRELGRTTEGDRVWVAPVGTPAPNLATLEGEAPEEAVCHSTWGGYSCTLQAGHEGLHRQEVGERFSWVQWTEEAAKSQREVPGDTGACICLDRYTDHHMIVLNCPIHGSASARTQR